MIPRACQWSASVTVPPVGSSWSGPPGPAAAATHWHRAHWQRPGPGCQGRAPSGRCPGLTGLLPATVPVRRRFARPASSDLGRRARAMAGRGRGHSATHRRGRLAGSVSLGHSDCRRGGRPAPCHRRARPAAAKITSSERFLVGMLHVRN